MSQLKKKIIQKLNKLDEIKAWFGSVTESDISFYKNGNRMDVVRWECRSMECFFSASEAAQSNTTLNIDGRVIYVDGEIHHCGSLKKVRDGDRCKNCHCIKD
jgi:hypothetical protein